jgi:hypothetical protein
MTWEDAIAIGTRLPGVEVSTSYGTPALKVKGKLLARLRPEDDSLVLLDVGFDERELLIEMEPETFHFTDHYKDYPAVLARLGPLTPERLMVHLERRWRHVAPKALVKAYDGSAGDQGAGP